MNPRFRVNVEPADYFTLYIELHKFPRGKGKRNCYANKFSFESTNRRRRKTKSSIYYVMSTAEIVKYNDLKGD